MAGAEQMLRATIEAGMKMRVIRPADLKRVNVDTTVRDQGNSFFAPKGRAGSCQPERSCTGGHRHGLF
jgi:hypothetical protein